MLSAPDSPASRSVRYRVFFCVFVVFTLLPLPDALPASDEGRPYGCPPTDRSQGLLESPSSRTPGVLAQNKPMPAPQSPAQPAASSRTEEWRLMIRTLEPKELKTDRGWRRQGLGPGESGPSEGRRRGIRDEALLLLLELQREQVMSRLQSAQVPSGTIRSLEQDYVAVHACLERRFGASKLPAILEEARGNRALLEKLVYHLLDFPPIHGTGFAP